MLEPAPTTLEEFENGGFTLKTHQFFSIHTRAGGIGKQKTGVTVYLGFVLKENSDSEITLLF